MDMHFILLVIGGLLLVGLVVDAIGRKTRLPRVTLLILFGIAIGPSGFDFLPETVQSWYEFIMSMALTMVAFLLGGRLSVTNLRHHGREILTISLVVVVITAVIVCVGLIAIGTPVLIALLLAGIATATDPAATRDVVGQSGVKGPFADTLLGIVAIDDAWGLVVFSLLLSTAIAFSGHGITGAMEHGILELGGAITIGTAVGLPGAFLTGHLRPGEPTQAEALGLVFISAGLAIWMGTSYLLSGMVAGAIIVNLAKHHHRPFHEIEHIEWPFMVLFFVLAGASLHLHSLYDIGLVGIAFLVLRAFARVLGGWLGGKLSGAPDLHSRWVGPALMPQAGVALGMALVAGNHFPQLKEILLTVTISTTVVFELTGPFLTQIALLKVSKGDVDADT